MIGKSIHASFSPPFPLNRGGFVPTAFDRALVLGANGELNPERCVGTGTVNASATGATTPSNGSRRASAERAASARSAASSSSSASSAYASLLATGARSPLTAREAAEFASRLSASRVASRIHVVAHRRSRSSSCAETPRTRSRHESGSGMDGRGGFTGDAAAFGVFPADLLRDPGAWDPVVSSPSFGGIHAGSLVLTSSLVRSSAFGTTLPRRTASTTAAGSAVARSDASASASG